MGPGASAALTWSHAAPTRVAIWDTVLGLVQEASFGSGYEVTVDRPRIGVARWEAG